MNLEHVGQAIAAESPVPQSRQLSNWIRGQIALNRIQPGERLPSERELADQLHLSRYVVNSAFAILEAEGLIYSRVGKGSFVMGAPAARPAGWSSLAKSPAPPAGALRIQYHFDSSRPSEDLFPVEEFREACAEVLSTAAGTAQVLQLGAPQGLPALREFILAEAISQNVAGAGDDVLITSGCQQAMDLIQRFVAAQPNPSVAIEDPVYPGIQKVFSRDGTRVIGVPAGTVGIEMYRLAETLERHKPRLLVVTPSFQNPTGGTISNGNRADLASHCEAHGTLIVENGIYSILRYGGEPTVALRAHSRDNVLTVGSFSKLTFPGLRVGWIIGPRPVIAALTQIRHWCDLHTDHLSQAVLLRFAESGRLAAHRDRVLQHGGKRLKAVLDACKQYMPKGSVWTHPQGGMNIWVELPNNADTTLLLPEAQHRGVNYMPGPVFAVEAPATHALRLSFGGLPPKSIVDGVKILGDVFKRYADSNTSKERPNETALV
ncbi:MAG: PLP-dependent aminotransferase family protein [Acidobacteria bacterium]|nr:PLP-dependent aminotransferase family protein [Acidobacteriota bacterium]